MTRTYTLAVETDLDLIRLASLPLMTLPEAQAQRHKLMAMAPRATVHVINTATL